MKRLALCCLLLTIGLLCRLPLVAAGKTESKDTPRPAEKMKPTDEPNQAGEKQPESPDTVHTAQDGNAAGSAQTEEIAADTASADTTQTEKVSAETAKSAATNSGTASPADGTDGKKDESGEPVDSTFASIHSKGLQMVLRRF